MLMLTTWLRKTTQWLLFPIASSLGRMGIVANTLTVVGCLLNITVGIMLAQGLFLPGGLLLILASGFDAADGTLARKFGGETKFGGFLDSCLDRVSESAILLGLMWWYLGQPGVAEEFLAALAIFGGMMVSYTRARAEGLGLDCKVGFFTRVERTIVMILGLVSGLVPLMVYIMAVGTVLTAAHRMLYVYQHTKGQAL